MSKPKNKTCTLCTQTKPRSDFPETERGKGKAEFCISCKETYQHHFLLMNHGTQAIDALTQDEADLLLLHNIIEFKRNEYRVIDELTYVKTHKEELKTKPLPLNKVIAIGKYNEKRKVLSKKQADQLVKEGAAVWEKEHYIRHLFSGKELQAFVVERDKGICYFCKQKGTKITFHVPRSQNGLLSPTNSICCCQDCKETEGENLYFYQWLNVPIIKLEERHLYPNAYHMIEKKMQTSFYVTFNIGEKLLQEKMAEKSDNHTIHILYDRHEFRELILTRDNYVCQYCQQYGDTLDHVHPQADGGLTTPLNCICACETCNGKKADKSPERFPTKQTKTNR